MLTQEQIADSARRLDDAERARTQIRQLSLDFPQVTIDDGYAIQRTWVADYYGPLGALGCRFV